MKLSLILLFLSVGLVCGRTWTDVQGRKVVGEFLRLDAGSPVVSINGKEMTLPLDKLSAEDQAFVADLVKAEAEREAEAVAKKEDAAKAIAAGDYTIDGTPVLKGGKTTIIERPYPEAWSKILSKKRRDEISMKMGIILPPDFDPSKPQRVYVVSTAVNSPAEGREGNLAKLRGYSKTCSEKGWISIAFDSNTGVPASDFAMVLGMQLLVKEWPVLKDSEYGFGGFSGGSKACSGPVAWFIKNDYKVVGAFLGGSNFQYFETSRKHYGAPRGPYGKIKAMVSSGEQDTVASVDAGKGVMAGLKAAGVGEVHQEVHSGGHSFYEPHFAMALDWWAGGELPKDDKKAKKGDD